MFVSLSHLCISLLHFYIALVDRVSIRISDTAVILNCQLLFVFSIGAVRSKGPVVQYTQDLTGTGTQFKPLEPPQPIAPPAPPVAPPLSPQAGDTE